MSWNAKRSVTNIKFFNLAGVYGKFFRKKSTFQPTSLKSPGNEKWLVNLIWRFYKIDCYFHNHYFCLQINKYFHIYFQGYKQILVCVHHFSTGRSLVLYSNESDS